MANREVVRELEQENPNLSWEEVFQKYNGDHGKIIEKSLESNRRVNNDIERWRGAGEL